MTSALIGALAVFASAPGTAYAAAGSPLIPGSVGSDVSWPQCGQTMPTEDPTLIYRFGVIGVTGGRPFTGNPCLAPEYKWASDTGMPELYINLEYGQARTGPLQCTDADAGCQAYNYGYDTAYWAVQYANADTGGLTASLSVWWLDVETGNVWSTDVEQNTYVIQGALDYFQRAAGKIAGIYSTSYQWGQIAGDFAPPSTPNWVAGSEYLNQWSQCSNPLWPGGKVWAIQYLNYDLDLDQNAAC